MSNEIRVVPVEASEWAEFMAAYDRWCAARQPKIVESGLKAAALRDAEFRESATRFCQAAAQIAYTAKTSPAAPPAAAAQGDDAMDGAKNKDWWAPDARLSLFSRLCEKGIAVNTHDVLTAWTGDMCQHAFLWALGKKPMPAHIAAISHAQPQAVPGE